MNKDVATVDGSLRTALRKVTAAYVSDCRWPPPSSPGRFNVPEGTNALFAANKAFAAAMKEHNLDGFRALYSPDLMDSQIKAAKDELSAMDYFVEN